MEVRRLPGSSRSAPSPLLPESVRYHRTWVLILLVGWCLMRRATCLVFLTVILLASVTKAQVKYFPPDFPANWYTQHLSALNESSLWESSQTQKTQSYRFLWLRTFHHPIVVRIDVNANGTSLLTTKMTSGAGGYKPGKLILNERRTLTSEQTNWFLGKIEVHNFWKLPSIQEDRGVDGAQWIIEGARNGTYHIVDRWSPEDGEIRALGLLMLNDLAKMKLAAKEVY